MFASAAVHPVQCNCFETVYIVGKAALYASSQQTVLQVCLLLPRAPS